MISRPRWLRWDGFLAVLLTMTGIIMAAAESYSVASSISLVAAAVAVQRRHPLWMSVLALLSGVVQILTGSLLLLLVWVYFLLTRRLGMDPDAQIRRWGLACCGLGIGAFVILHLSQPRQVRWNELFMNPVSLILSLVPVLLLSAPLLFGGWLSGYAKLQRALALQARFDAVEQRRLADRYHQEQIRRRIAADMHDIAAHSWAVVAAQADGARYRLHEAPDEAEQALRTIADTARRSMDELRALLEELRSGDSGEHALTGGRHQLFTRMRDAGMILEHDEKGTIPDHPLLAVTAERLLGECLTNALKHGDLKVPVSVSENWTGGYRLTVTNAVHPQKNNTHHGHGLDGMAERVRLLGGTFRAARHDDHWQVDITLPEMQGETA
ncbi:Signal transduction histidine kinase [Austwickia chelonae]|uniref:histidine kinase n=1 Tax=Austwickia chelonae NBRC 105200 TaxID=1184607 RepID=K6W9K9_9MICO|nr:histidine kinase [Austwickia chelonae]GAB78497.1 putative two-component histidine kinase [Austwickia chelonae NBRC 105200]SEW40155.1 Signal transduction histidine kinase [Austwickia chelonae]